MGFIVPFIAIMLDKNGLSAIKIASCLMVYKAVQLIAVIPGGVLADKYNRRNILITAQIFAISAYIFWLLMPTFLGYFLGYICWGFWGSLISGCEEAFLYDKLKKYNKRNIYEIILGRGNALVSFGTLIASIFSAYLIKIGFDFNSLIVGSIITTLIGTIALSTVKSVKKTDGIKEPKNILSYMQILKKGFRYSWKHTTVFKFISFLSFITFINVNFDEYSEIFYNDLTHNLSKVAIIFGTMEIMFIIGNLSANYFKKIPFKILISFYFFIGLSNILAFTLYSYPISLIIIMINTIIMVGISVNFSAKINDFIPSETRATILSIKGFIESFGALITLFFFGRITDYFHSYKMGFLTFAYLFTIGSFGFLIVFWTDKHLLKKEERLK